jgi:hypothetical protein
MSAGEGEAGARLDQSERPSLTDAVEKVENRTTPKISQMLIFGLLRRCDASVVPIRTSVVVFLRHDVVPHVAPHETHQEL